MRKIFIFIAAILAATGLFSCISDEVSTSSADRLSFSSDTVSFDTVFTDLGTPTARLQVFNRNKKGLNISKIRFRSDNSPFSLNVDGVSGTEFSDVEIRANDSIYIFIECYIPESADRQPQLVEDELVFTTNGVEQRVLVEAWGQNVVRLRDVVVEDELTLDDAVPYVIFNELRVADGAVLKVLPGARLLFHDKASLRVEGRLEAVGEPGRMIDMRGDRLDNVLPDVGYDILSGQWKGVSFAPGSFDNRMEYVDMRSTTDGLSVDSCGVTDRTKLTLLNSWLHNSKSTALRSEYAKVDAYGCVFSEAAEAVVRLTGGVHEFVQCTISNYYLFAAITEPLLTLHHIRMPDPQPAEGVPALPFMSLSFENGIIYGLGDDLNEGDLDGTDVYLRNVILKSEGTDDEHFVSCLWDTDPMFLTVREDYYFNYHVAEDSPAIGAGNPAYVRPPFETDMDGVNRLAAGAPTLGAYAD